MNSGLMKYIPFSSCLILNLRRYEILSVRWQDIKDGILTVNKAEKKNDQQDGKIMEKDRNK